MRNLGEFLEVTGDPREFIQLRKCVEEAEIPMHSAEVSYIPLNTVTLDAGQARKIIHLMEDLEEHDDVQNLAANFDIPDEVLAEVS